MFQLTAPIVRRRATSGEKFAISMERVMIGEEEVRGAQLCVQDFVWSPHFTQRSFFSDSGITMLAESAAICDSITNSGVLEPWSHVQTADCISFAGGGWGLCLRESGCGSPKGGQGFTRTVAYGGRHQAIFRRLSISVWCEGLQDSGRGTSWIPSCESSFN